MRTRSQRAKPAHHACRTHRLLISSDPHGLISANIRLEELQQCRMLEADFRLAAAVCFVSAGRLEAGDAGDRAADARHLRRRRRSPHPAASCRPQGCRLQHQHEERLELFLRVAARG